MAKVKANEIRGLSSSELEQKKGDLQKALFELRQKQLVGQLDKPHLFKATRRQIAQINTVMREKKNG